MTQSQSTKEQIIEYAKAHESKTQGEIATVVGVSRSYVSGVLREHYPEHPSVQSPLKLDQILAYADDHPDATGREIAETVGASYSYTATKLQEHRPNHSRRTVSEESEQKIRELANQTPLLSVGEISQQCDVDLCVVRRVMRDMEVRR